MNLELTSMIDFRRLTKLVLFALIIPVTIGGIADYILDMTPVLLIAVSLFCIPLTSIWVTRVVLSEMDRIIEAAEAEVSQVLEIAELETTK